MLTVCKYACLSCLVLFIIPSNENFSLLLIRIAGIGTWVVIKAIAVLLNKIFGLEDPTIIKEDDQQKKIIKEEEGQKEEEQPQVSTHEETAKNDEAKDESGVEA